MKLCSSDNHYTTNFVGMTYVILCITGYIQTMVDSLLVFANLVWVAILFSAQYASTDSTKSAQEFVAESRECKFQVCQVLPSC